MFREERPASDILASLENISFGKARMCYIYGEGYGSTQNPYAQAAEDLML